MSNEKQPKTLPIWVYQQAFAKLSREVFNYLDEDLRPRFLIVGIPRLDEEAAWIEPSEDSGYSHDDFRGVLELAGEIEAEEAAKNAWKNQSADNTDVQITAKSIQRALEKTLHNRDSAAKSNSYCSEPVPIGDYDFCCILEFDEPAFSKHFSVPVRWINNSRLAGSLIDATAVEFLRVCRTVLEGPRRTLNGLDPLGHQPEDILRMGGRALMLTANQVGAGTTFDDLNKLSWKTHEGEIAGGELHFIHWDEYYLDIHIEFKQPPGLSNIEAARKLIEMAAAKRIATGKMHLISHGDEIGGIGSLREADDEYDRDNSNVFIVRFTGYYKWEL